MRACSTWGRCFCARGYWGQGLEGEGAHPSTPAAPLATVPRRSGVYGASFSLGMTGTLRDKLWPHDETWPMELVQPSATVLLPMGDCRNCSIGEMLHCHLLMLPLAGQASAKSGAAASAAYAPTLKASLGVASLNEGTIVHPLKKCTQGNVPHATPLPLSQAG